MPKRGAQGNGSIRQRPDGRWEARYVIGRDPGTGKQIRKSVYADTQKEVRQKLNAAVKAIDEGTYYEPAKMSLAQWVDIWLEEYTDDKKYLTVKHYKAQCDTHIKPALGAIKLESLTTPQIQKFYNSLLRRKEKPLSPKSVRNIHGILTKCLSIAVQVGYLRQNPAQMVTLPRATRKEISPLTDEQVRELIRLADNDSFGTLFKVVVFTGIRESEATGLTWDCVDFDKGTIKISKQLIKRPIEDGGFTFGPLKNDRIREITASPFVIDLLREQQKRQIESRLRAGEYWRGWQSQKERSTYFVFANDFGEHLHPQTVYNHYKKLAVKIGAPDSCVHDLRHTFAVLSLQNGDDVKTVQDNLGHATAAFTLDVYGHVSQKMKSDSAERMQNYILALENL